MTIYHRLKVWGIKGYRFVRYGFKQIHPRTVNQIFLLPVNKKCDYCGYQAECATLECDFEVYATICESCLNKAIAAVHRKPAAPSGNLHIYSNADTRGVVTH